MNAILTALSNEQEWPVVRARPASHQCGLGSNPGIDAICWLNL